MVRSALVVCLLTFLSTACTSIGVHSAREREQLQFGPPQTLALCLHVDDGIDEREARALVEEAWGEEGKLYALTIRVAGVTRWKRQAFTIDGLMEAITREPLEPPCDRVMALVGRNVGDVLWALVGMPEVLGAVNEGTLTHGYTVARRASLNQVFSSPAAILRHELYHMLGCEEHFNMPGCYAQIARLKRWRAEQAGDFFPAWDALQKRILPTRAAVNARLSGAEDAPQALPRDGVRPHAENSQIE